MVVLAIGNQLRSLIPGDRASLITDSREDLYSADQHRGLRRGYKDAAQQILATECRRIGILAHMPIPSAQLEDSPPSYYIYPLFALVNASGGLKQFE